MAKIIVAIHGLRNKPPKKLLEKWGLLSIEEGFRNMGWEVKLPKFELVYWADILYDKPLLPDIKDSKNPYFLDEVYTPNPVAVFEEKNISRQKIVHRFIKNFIYKLFLKKDYQLKYPFLSKGFIHNNFRELEVYFTENCEDNYINDCILKKRINLRLIEILKKYADDQIFLIAHSMGSIIAFDVLSFILKDIKIHTLVTLGAPLGAPFVVARIAKYSKKHFNQVKLQTPEAVSRNWYNFSDIRDNIAMDAQLSDDFVSNTMGVRVIDKLVTNTYEMNGIINPHKSFGYLRTPEFIKVLKEFIEE